MKNLILQRVTIALLLILLSCQENISGSTPFKETNITPLPQTQSVNSPHITPSETNTPIAISTIINASINFLPVLSGSLFVGSADSGEYIKLDFDNDLAFRFYLPKYCELLSVLPRAVCETDNVSDKTEVYVYDILTGQQNFIERKDIGTWNIASSEQILMYTLAGPNGSEISINAYDFRSNASIYIGTFNNEETIFSIPRLSNSAQSMIGVDYEESSWDTDDNWYVMDASIMKAEALVVPENIAATDSIEWSPNNAMVALVGFYRSDEVPHAGNLRCGKEALIYDPVSKIVKLTIKVPEERCYDHFYLHPRSIWSPDSTKLALVLDQQDICIVDVSEKKPKCFLISNYYQSENYIARLAWSPDSQYIAFISGAGEIQVHSVKDNKTYLIATIDNLSTLPIGSELIWRR
ncbi:MAG: hypothetical protein AABZ00_11585 [Chloroflexota bacterium]